MSWSGTFRRARRGIRETVAGREVARAAHAPAPASASASLSPAAPAPRLRADALALRLRHPGGDALPPESALRGWLEHASLREGIGGWLVDRHAPEAGLELALCVDGTPVVRRRAGRPRPDLWADGDTDPTFAPGFLFGPDALDAVAACDVDDPEAKLAVRPVGADACLDGLDLPTLGQLRRWLLPEGREAGGTRGDDDTAGLPLAVALERLALRAASLQRTPLRADESLCAGFVEMLMPLDAQRQFIGGWFPARAARERPVVVVAEGRKHPGALCVVTYPRGDLPAGALAFFGVLQGAWRPASAQDQAFLFLGDAQGAWLRSNQPLRLGGPGDAQERLQWLRAALEDASGQRRLAEFGRQLDTPSRWAPTPQRGAAQGVHAGIDTVALLPGFGAIVEGWIVVAGAEVADTSLRIGGTTLDGDRGAWSLRPRADLGDAFPGLRDRLGRAGFTAVLRGPLPVEAGDDPRLAFDLDDGRRLVIPIDPATLRRIDARLPAARLEALAPGLAQSSWRADFVRAWSALARTQAANGLQVTLACRAAEIVAVVLPLEAPELALMFDRLADAASAVRVPPGAALVLLATPAHDTRRVQRGVAVLRDVLGAARVGLAQVPELALALQALPAVCEAAGAERFACLGPACVPMADVRAWDAIAAALHAARTSGASAVPVFLPVAGWHQGRVALAREAGAFAWTREAFAAWLAETPLVPIAPGELAGGLALPGADAAWPAGTAPAVQRLRRRARTAWAPVAMPAAPLRGDRA